MRLKLIAQGGSEKERDRSPSHECSGKTTLTCRWFRIHIHRADIAIVNCTVIVPLLQWHIHIYTGRQTDSLVPVCRKTSV